MKRPGVSPVVVFVASNATHRATFEPVIERLTASGARSVLVVLNEFYGPGGRSGGSIQTHALRREGGPLPPNQFYARDVVSIWLDVLRARRHVDALLQSLRPSSIVLGNDFGLLEKLFLSRARHRGIPGVLVQDGRIAARPGDAGRRKLLRIAKYLFSPALRAMQLGYLAASEYGEGGARVICAADKESAALLRSRAKGQTSVVMTGQPRYDALRQVHLAADDRRLTRRRVVMFTTPFSADRLGDAEQRRQEEFAGMLSSITAEQGGDFVVRPHPRESWDGYRAAGIAVSDAPPAALLANAWLAVIGISTVIEEAVWLQTPVVVPGRSVHPRRFDHRLPDSRWFPRIDTPSDAQELLHDLADARAWSAMAANQRQALVGADDSETQGTAAAAVADAILHARRFAP